MIRKVAVAITALAATGSTALASVTFQNTGTTSGWSGGSNARGTARIYQVSSPVYKGGTALAHEVNWVGEGTANHAELMQYNAQSLGQDRYYGQAIRLPADWFFMNKNATFQQFSPENPSGPWTLNWIQNHDIRIRVQADHHVVGTINAGVWVRVVYRLKMAATGGAAEYWTNGTKTLSRTNFNMTPSNGSQTIRWSTGVYATHWRNATQLEPGEPAKKLIYHDHMRIATTYAEADPASWTDGGTTPTPTPVPTATPGPTPTPGGGFSGYYRIMARHSGKAVVVQGASTANGGNVIQWTYGGTSTNDEWQLVNLGTGYYRIVNRNSGRVLDVSGASTANAANVHQWAWGGATNQQWQVVNLGNGYHRLTARHSGKVLNVAGASTADGANVDQWSWANVNQQQFQLVSVP